EGEHGSEAQHKLVFQQEPHEIFLRYFAGFGQPWRFCARVDELVNLPWLRASDDSDGISHDPDIHLSETKFQSLFQFSEERLDFLCVLLDVHHVFEQCVLVSSAFVSPNALDRIWIDGESPEF